MTGEKKSDAGKWKRRLVCHGTPSSQVPKLGILTAVTSKRGGIARGRLQINTKVGIHFVDMGRIVPSDKVRVKYYPNYGCCN